jgi:hypothetical protein
MMCVLKIQDSTTIGPQIIELGGYKWGISISDRNKTSGKTRAGTYKREVI